jgi:hypothetical protein
MPRQQRYALPDISCQRLCGTGSSALLMIKGELSHMYAVTDRSCRGLRSQLRQQFDLGMERDALEHRPV